MVKDFLLEYASLNHLGLAAFCLNLPAVTYFPVISAISECLEGWHCPSAKKVFFEEHFQEKIKQILTDSSFCIRKFEDEVSSYTGPRVDTLHPWGEHLFSVDRVNRTMYYSGVLAPGMIQEKANVHVIIAQKESS